jgi:hypothetical protein
VPQVPSSLQKCDAQSESCEHDVPLARWQAASATAPTMLQCSVKRRRLPPWSMRGRYDRVDGAVKLDFAPQQKRRLPCRHRAR